MQVDGVDASSQASLVTSVEGTTTAAGDAASSPKRSSALIVASPGKRGAEGEVTTADITPKKNKHSSSANSALG